MQFLMSGMEIVVSGPIERGDKSNAADRKGTEKRRNARSLDKSDAL
jgi:hypothetical protein